MPENHKCSTKRLSQTGFRKKYFLIAFISKQHSYQIGQSLLTILETEFFFINFHDKLLVIVLPVLFQNTMSFFLYWTMVGTTFKYSIYGSFALIDKFESRNPSNVSKILILSHIVQVLYTYTQNCCKTQPRADFHTLCEMK